MIDNSPVHSTSQTSQADVDQLEHQESDTLQQGSFQQEDIEEKASLASHSNASVKSKSSRVSVASSKSSIHSRESVASKTSSSSSISSRTSLPNRQSSSSHSLGKVDSSEFPAASDNSLTQSGSAMLNRDDGINPETADADTQYNYEDDNFEELEEVDPEEVQASEQQPEVELLEDTDPELRKETKVSDSDPAKELTIEDPTHQTEKQFNDTDPALSKEQHLSDAKPDDDTDMGHSAEYDYEDDKFEETNPEEPDEPKQQPEEHSEDTNPVTTETPPSPSQSAEGGKESARETPAPVEGSEEKESRVNADSSNDIEDHETDSKDAVVKVPSRQSSNDGTNAKDTVNPESDKEAPNIEELHTYASKAGLEEVKDDGVSEGQSQAPVISGDAWETQMESKDQADVSNEQLPQGILLNTGSRKSTGLSVSFEAVSESATRGKQQQGARGEQQSAKDLSASLTIEEAKKMLQKSQSTASLGSLLNEKESTPVGSDLDLSGSEDEDIPDLEQKISDLIDGDSGETGDNTQENAEAGKVNEKEDDIVDSMGSEDKVESQKAATPQPVLGNDKETTRAEENTESQEDTETAMVPASEKETAGAEEKTEDAETAVILGNEKECVEQPSEEIKSEDQDKTSTSLQTEITKEVANQDATVEKQGQGIHATNSQTETAKEVAEIPDQEPAVEHQDIPPTNSQTETAKEVAEIPDQEPAVEDQDIPPTNSQIETAKEASEEDTANQEAKAGTTAGEPELAAEPADISDVGSVKSGLSSSSSKSSLTSVSSQGSHKDHS